MTEEQTKIEDEPIESFIRQDVDEDPADAESPVEILEGEIVAEEAEREEIDELTALRLQLEAAQSQADEYLDDLRRERAAFQNYKKRQENERAELRQIALGGMLTQVLPIIDDLNRALEAVPEDQSDQPWIEGIKLIQRKFQTVIKSVGVVAVEAEPGQPFDPFVHEAVSHEESEEHQGGEIIAVLQTGYVLGQRTLRPAMVRVAK